MAFILLNTKNYHTGMGQALCDMLSTIQKTQIKTGQKIAVAVNILDIVMACERYGNDIDIFAQHVDACDFGASTGNIVPAYIKEKGVKGVILNHSEKRFGSELLLYTAIEQSKQAGLIVVCCSESVEEGKKIAQHTSADYIAVEPPELIGGKISVSKARPEIIEESVGVIGMGRVLIGAGIATAEDIAIAVQKGACGVLLASSVMKAENIENALDSLLLS